MIFKEVSENSFIIYFSDEIELEVSNKIKSLFLEISKFDEIVDLVFSYTSLLVTFDILKTEYLALKEKIKTKQNTLANKSFETKLIKIPVYYGKEHGFDLEQVSKSLKLDIEELIHLHTETIYDVYSLGFLPGFAYLGQVNKKLYTNRLQTPRKKVPKGSVAIANLQTAIYPKDSPGGWNIIGKTPLKLFDKTLENYSLLSINHRVKFQAISKDEFLSLGGKL